MKIEWYFCNLSQKSLIIHFTHFSVSPSLLPLHLLRFLHFPAAAPTSSGDGAVSVIRPHFLLRLVFVFRLSDMQQRPPMSPSSSPFLAVVQGELGGGLRRVLHLNSHFQVTQCYMIHTLLPNKNKRSFLYPHLFSLFSSPSSDFSGEMLSGGDCH